MPLDPVAYSPYSDPDDFIREVTDLIWVRRAIGHIRENYEHDSIVHGAFGTSIGSDEVLQGSLMRIAATAVAAHDLDLPVSDRRRLVEAAHGALTGRAENPARGRIPAHDVTGR